jgi:hypothetical protein
MTRQGSGTQLLRTEGPLQTEDAARPTPAPPNPGCHTGDRRRPPDGTPELGQATAASRRDPQTQPTSFVAQGGRPRCALLSEREPCARFMHSHAYFLTVRSTLSALMCSFFRCSGSKSDRIGARLSAGSVRYDVRADHSDMHDCLPAPVNCGSWVRSGRRPRARRRQSPAWWSAVTHAQPGFLQYSSPGATAGRRA